MKPSSIPTLLFAALMVVVFQSFSWNSKKNIEKSDSQISQILSNVDATAINFKNMQEAYKVEANSSLKYEAFCKKAEEEGFHEIAILFKATSVAEKIHATGIKAVLDGYGQKTIELKTEFEVKSTEENLKAAIAEEQNEIDIIYPEYITNANSAGNKASLVSLNYAYKTEQKQKPYYEKALTALNNNSVKSLPKVYFVCPTCGYTYENAVPKRCGISMTIGERFIKIASLNC